MNCIGDWVITQKTYTTNAFPFTRQYDHGDADQYYTESTHPAIITKETFEKAQALRQRRAWLGHESSMAYPLTLKIVCGKCGYRFDRRRTKNGLVSWVCSKHDDHAADCPMGRIPETEIYSAFVRMFNKLKQHEAIILKPALAQLDDLNAALQRDDPAMLAVNKAVADASEQSYKVTVLQARGSLDADACAAKLQAIQAQITELSRERRRLLKNEDLEDVMEALRQTADTIGSCHGRADRHSV